MCVCTIITNKSGGGELAWSAVVKKALGGIGDSCQHLPVSTL